MARPLHDVWHIVSAADAARARIVAARLTADAGVSPLERARFLIAVTARLRQCLRQGGADLTLAVHDCPGEDRRARIVVQPADEPADAASWQITVSCCAPVRRLPGRPLTRDLAEALLAADDDLAEVVERLEEKQELVRFHREELHQTNQGVLALHADLESAARIQEELLAAERSARADAERARQLLTFLADASDTVTASLDPSDIMRRLPELLVPDYASHVEVWLFNNEIFGHGVRPAAAVVAARSGRPQHAAAHPGGLPGVDDLPSSALAPDRPLLCIPLTARRALGVVTLTAPDDGFDPDVCVMLVELARRVATALANARSYTQHRDIAEALQHAQLTDLPATSDLHLAARYLPATYGLNIGGDWYDAFRQPDGSMLAVIGDVTGHGLHAAVLMGQLRTALRAYAVEGDSPGQILTRLHRMLRHQQPDLYATALIARFRPGDPTVVWAAAGHPPAILRTPDGTVRSLEGAPGAMLGIPLDATYPEHAAHVPSGSTLALYTDGLVERRAQGIDPGIDRLAQALAALSTADLQNLDDAADALLKPLLHDCERDDDVCMLLCRTSSPECQPAMPQQSAKHSRPSGRGPVLESVESARGEGDHRDCS
ncbi:PP2C family protein-serine/threonine phosphatase [Streptomyces sp. NPDC057340]|uniref:PP2C family protein-serine/threonine phosphatase n=1 Tax=Streptomyces sp. NPDC057340 TaxID=3346103 RepID=UPI003642CCC5